MAGGKSFRAKSASVKRVLRVSRIRRHWSRCLHPRAREALEVVLGHRLRIGWCWSNATKLWVDAKAGGDLAVKRTDGRNRQGGHLRSVCRGQARSPKHLARNVHDMYSRRSTKNSSRGRSGVSPTRSLRLSRSWIPSHSSRPPRSWVSFWKRISHNRSRPRGGLDTDRSFLASGDFPEIRLIGIGTVVTHRPLGKCQQSGPFISLKSSTLPL